MKDQSAREKLERVFKEFKDLPYPTSGRGQEILDVHSTLILYDADVAAALLRVLRSQSLSPDLGRLTGLQEDPALERMIDRLLKKYPADDEIGSAAREYANRYAMLKKVVQAARSYLGLQDP